MHNHSKKVASSVPLRSCNRTPDGGRMYNQVPFWRECRSQRLEAVHEHPLKLSTGLPLRQFPTGCAVWQEKDKHYLKIHCAGGSSWQESVRNHVCRSCCCFLLKYCPARNFVKEKPIRNWLVTRTF